MTDRRRHFRPLRRTGTLQAPDWSPRVPARSPRDAGPSARERRLVFARAFGCCESCGTNVIGRPYTIAPRVARDAGSAPRAEAAATWNLTLLCGSAAGPGGCYWLCERRDPSLRDHGIWMYSWENPRLVPVQLLNRPGQRIPVWLNDEGTYDFEEPAGGFAVRGARL